MAPSIVEIHPDNPQPRTIARAVAFLDGGELISYPTDTSYALGCDLSSKRAIDRLYQLKGHDRKRPMSLIVPDLSEVARYAKVSNYAYRILRRFTPGPFTFILEATRLVPDQLQTKQRTVGLRLPSHPVPRALAGGLGRPLVTTTAGRHGVENYIDCDQIRERLGHGLALLLDAGTIVSEDSTVVSLIDDRAELLREGKGDAAELLG